jgi:hypothetical protein
VKNLTLKWKKVMGPNFFYLSPNSWNPGYAPESITQQIQMLLLTITQS